MKPIYNYEGLQPEKIIGTIEHLEHRIGERFSQANLRKVANRLLEISQEAARRADKIRRPNIPLRLMIFGLLGLAAVMVFSFARLLNFDEKEMFSFDNFVQSLDATLESSVFIGAAIIFLLTLELRLKRKRLLDAVHELRALAHIVDMHQLTKDPEHMIRGPVSELSAKGSMTLFELVRYLDYCSELLSLISKVGALYVQNFPDPIAVEAVDQLSTLTNGLSRNIWQKIMILENMIGPAAEEEPPPASEPLANRAGNELH